MLKYSLITLNLFLCFVTAQHLLLAGGNLKDDSAHYWKRLVHLAGGKGATIAVFTCGSDNPDADFELISKAITNFGANASHIQVSINDIELANDEDTAELVKEHTAVFFGDGDVPKIIGALRNEDGSDTEVLEAIRSVFNERGVIGGSGAGAMVLTSAPVIISGDSYESLLNKPETFSFVPLTTTTTQRIMRPRRRKPKRGRKRRPQKDQPVIPTSNLIYIDSGFGFMKNWSIDTRFNDLSRQGRLMSLLLNTKILPSGTGRGIGIDEEMGLAIYRVGREDEFAEVLGNRGGVSLVDTSSATLTLKPLHIDGVQMTFFTEDDKLILDAAEIIPATWKADVDGQEWHILAETSNDIFSSRKNPNGTPGQFLNTAKRLFDSCIPPISLWKNKPIRIETCLITVKCQYE
ncbi:hypothetical protein QYM36_015328 [Artemia franciscana]|uniref:Cyanophycinase n=1 Tax=Artemia franciscana TaxID=6661 RepID=A0AA88HEI2_ARTSF|nr:hypothetical protein QYM36_015328 [Artemia franciscana]